MKRIFVVAAIVYSSHIKAQTLKTHLEEADTTVISLDEVVFTANKFLNKTSLTGKVLTIITREQLERSGGKDLAQVLNEQPGIYIGGAASNAGKDKSIYLRGAAIQHTLITIDGAPVYDPSGIGSNFDIRNISIDNIERIEILKGSQSTLYGSDAIAGVINIITRKPKNNPLNGTGVISYGSHETFRLNAGIDGKKDRFDYNFGYSFYNTNGINEAASTTPDSDRDGFQQNNLSLKFGLEPNDKIRLQPFFRYNKIRGDIDQGAFTDELDYTFREINYQAGMRNEFNLRKTKLNLVYNYNDLEREYIDDSTKSRNGFDIYSRGSYQAAEHFMDAWVSAPLSKVLKLVAGADFRHSNADLDYLSVSSYGPYHKPNTRDSLNQNQAAVYSAITVMVNELIAEAGSRVNFHSEYGIVQVFNLNPSLLLDKKLKLFSNLSTGYRTPSLYQLFSEYGNRDLKPERSLSWEVGAQYYSTDKRLTGRAVYFSRKIKDLIFFYTDPAYNSWYINQDEQKDHGIELEAAGNFKKGNIKIFYSYVNGEITTRQNNKDTTYFNLLRRPKHSFGFQAGYHWGERFYISSNMAIIGERKDAYFDLLTFQPVNLTLKGYTTWDIYLDYAFRKNRFKLFADLRNITNSRYTEIAGFNTLGLTISGGIRARL